MKIDWYSFYYGFSGGMLSILFILSEQKKIIGQLALIYLLFCGYIHYKKILE